MVGAGVGDSLVERMTVGQFVHEGQAQGGGASGYLGVLQVKNRYAGLVAPEGPIGGATDVFRLGIVNVQKAPKYRFRHGNRPAPAAVKDELQVLFGTGLTGENQRPHGGAGTQTGRLAVDQPTTAMTMSGYGARIEFHVA